MKKRNITISLICFLIMAFLPVTAQAAWKNTANGMIYTTKSSPGYYVGWHTIQGAAYYFNENGVMQTGWKKIEKKYYYFGTDGKMRTGWQNINNKVYYLGSDGIRRTGWQTIKVDDITQKFFFSSKGVMRTGLRTIKNKMYYFSPNGALQKGFIKVNGKVYYGDSGTGVLAQDKWIGDYYFQKDGTMAVKQWIDGKWVGDDGRYTGLKNGWITENGKKCYYDKNGNKVFGWMTLSGKKYYLNQSTGVLQTGWFTVGKYTYYASSKGVVQTNKWKKKKYLQSSGAMATGWITVNGKRYYCNTSTGVRLTGWQKISNKYYYFDKNGVLQTNTWLENNTYYVGADGARCIGVTKVGKRYYYFSRNNAGKLLKGWIKYGNDLYYAHSSKGYLFVSKWFTKNSRKYYVGSDAKLYKGLKTISGKLYYFDTTNGRMAKNTMQTVDKATYYFESDGAAAKAKWITCNSKYYYFESNGKMAVNKWVGTYYVGADGARDPNKKLTVGNQKKNGKTYCYDSNGNMLKGWQTVNGSTYYFSSDGAAVTGLQVLDSKKYYFYPTGILAKSLTLAVGDKEYTINSSGVVTAEKTIRVSGSTTGSKIAKFAIKYVGNPYVYGGTSLTNGADCSGFVQTVFANYGIKLLRVADDQMKGPSQTYINAGYKKAVTVSTDSMLPGDLVFYGSSSYARHVGIYIGSGNIVHASNSQAYPLGGIKISPYNYTTPVKIVRYWS